MDGTVTATMTTATKTKSTIPVSTLTPEEHFEKLYQEYNVYVRKTLYYLVGRELAHDVLQEVFISVWKNLSKFRGDSSPKTWIYRITVNKAYDYLRREKQLVPEYPDAQTSAANAENEIFIRTAIEKSIGKLPAAHRVVFVLFYKQDLTIEEIASALEIAEGTVKSRLHTAREQFKHEIAKYGVKYE